MRWPIRNQILVPFITVVVLAVTAMAAVAALLAARQRDAQTLAQLQTVAETLSHASVPYTGTVLQQMRGLSGAHFVACDTRGGVVASTLPEGTLLPAGFDTSQRGGGLDSLSKQPTVTIDGTRYFLARMEPRRDAQVRSLYVLYPEERWSQARWDAALPPLIVGAAAVLLGSVVSGWLAQRFSQRIRLLQRQVAAIAAGDFTEIAASSWQDELQELTTSVNSMSSQLRQMQNAIRQSERTRLLAQLAGGLAHQLRNAVTGARMALQLHQRRCLSRPDDKSLPVALGQLELTEGQVRGLLSLGRGERSQPVDCEIGPLVEEIAGLLQPQCEHAGVRLDVDVAAVPGAVRADLESLRAAIVNLATNAIEAAGRGGEVTLRTQANKVDVSIEVADSGFGPPPRVADTLFEPFVSTKPEGVGLGLALARQVALDHGGTLTWRRETDRTIFRLTLPVHRPVPAPSALPDESRKSQIPNPKSGIPAEATAVAMPGP